MKEAINSNKFPYVVGNIEFDFVQPVHYSVTDKSGGAIVIEYTAEGRKIHDNTIRVMTNSPTYDWHMTNIKHYVHLENKRKPVRKYHDANRNEHVLPLLPASGLLGLPGDYSSPSRFVRAAAMVHFSMVPETFEEAVVTSFHILNSVDVSKGMVYFRCKSTHTTPTIPSHTYTHTHPRPHTHAHTNTHTHKRAQAVCFIAIRLKIIDIFSKQTNRQTDRQTDSQG